MNIKEAGAAPPGFFEGVAEFNRQEFFQCHETLESVWKDETGATRELTQGIIQIAVGYYHYLRGNTKGALKLLRRGVERVEKYLPACYGLNLTKLSQAVHLNIKEIVEVAESGLPPDNRIDIPQIETQGN